MSAKWRKLWIEESGSFAQLPLRARSLFRELLVLADDDGVIACGRRKPAEAICWALGADRSDRRLVREVLPMLLDDGCLAVVDGDLVFPGWARFQGDGQPPRSRRERASKHSSPSTESTPSEHRSHPDRASTEQRPSLDRATKVETSPRNHTHRNDKTKKKRKKKRKRVLRTLRGRAGDPARRSTALTRSGSSRR